MNKGCKTIIVVSGNKKHQMLLRDYFRGTKYDYWPEVDAESALSTLEVMISGFVIVDKDTEEMSTEDFSRKISEIRDEAGGIVYSPDGLPVRFISIEVNANGGLSIKTKNSLDKLVELIKVKKATALA